MINNKKRFRPLNGAGLVWFLLGAALILASALLVGKNLMEQQSAARQSASLLELAQQQMAGPAPSAPSGVAEEGKAAEDIEETSSAAPAFNWSNYNIAGILSLPDLGLELPVLGDYNDQLLKVSVCIFDWGDTEDPPRMVIAGHNYKAHFGSISKLSIGAKVTYQTMDGEKTQFQVDEIVEIDAGDGDAVDEGEWDLTLLTCNFDMSKRILVRCVFSEP